MSATKRCLLLLIAAFFGGFLLSPVSTEAEEANGGCCDNCPSSYGFRVGGEVIYLDHIDEDCIDIALAGGDIQDCGYEMGNREYFNCPL